MQHDEQQVEVPTSCCCFPLVRYIVPQNRVFFSLIDIVHLTRGLETT